MLRLEDRCLISVTRNYKIMIDWNIGEVDYLNQANYNAKRLIRNDPAWGREENLNPSRTVEGDALTIGEIMERALNGIVPPRKQVLFFDQSDMEAIRSFPIDLTDLESTRNELIDIQTRIDEAIAAEAAEEPVVEPPVIVPPVVEPPVVEPPVVVPPVEPPV